MAGESSTTTSSSKSKKYAKHAEEDAAFQSTTQSQKQQPKSSTTFIGRVLIFIGFPFVIGMIGLYMGYLAHKSNPTNRPMRIDTDFALPFVISLTMVVVIWFQTKGLSNTKPQPLVQWPKAIKRKKIIHKHVVVNSNSEGEAKKDD